VLRLPVAHCELNPIELAWASVKDYVAKHNKDYNLVALNTRRFCRHVVDIENEKDGLVEDVEGNGNLFG